MRFFYVFSFVLRCDIFLQAICRYNFSLSSAPEGMRFNFIRNLVQASFDPPWTTKRAFETFPHSGSNNRRKQPNSLTYGERTLGMTVIVITLPDQFTGEIFICPAESLLHVMRMRHCIRALARVIFSLRDWTENQTHFCLWPRSIQQLKRRVFLSTVP